MALPHLKEGIKRPEVFEALVDFATPGILGFVKMTPHSFEYFVGSIALYDKLFWYVAQTRVFPCHIGKGNMAAILVIGVFIIYP
jgi:hypothetical protein